MRKKKKITDIKKPKKRMKSIWVVLITALLTTLIVGGSFFGYFYLKGDFANKDNKENAKTEEDKIEGKNLLIATSNNGNLFINFYNLNSEKTITKKINTGVTIQGGKWDKDNKNEIVQFIEKGEYFIVLEVKEPSISDENEFVRIVKYSKDGNSRDVLFEEKNFLSVGNFVYGDGKIYYVYTNFKDNEIVSRDFYALDLETKKTEVVVKDVGDFLEKELTYKDNKVFSLYVIRGVVYESVIDIASKKINKTNLFKAQKTVDFELTAKEIYPSSDSSKYIFSYYTQKEGYQLKLYDKTSKKTSILVKDKDFSFENVIWKNDSEIVFKKVPAFSVSSVAKQSLVSLNINDISSEKVLTESELEINIILLSDDAIVFSEDKKVYLLKDEKKELNLTGFLGIQDTLFSGIFNY